MKLTNYRTAANNDDETEIMFPLLECWNPLTNIATIAAQVNQKRVLCRISHDVLKKKFRAGAKEPMKAVADNRAAIQSAAKKLIEKEAFEDDGSIIIRSRDI